MNLFDVSWWAWLLFAIGAWLACFLLALATRTRRRKRGLAASLFLYSLALAGVGCTILAVILAVREIAF